MATITKSDMKWVLNYAGTSPDTIELDEGASQTFVKGELVFYSAGSIIEIASDTPALIYGMAAADGHNAAVNTKKIPVYVVNENLLFEGNVLAASLADYVLAQGDLGTPMAIQRDTTNSRVFLDSGTKAGTNTRVFVHRVAAGSAIGDTNGRVLFSFIPKFAQSITSS